MDDEEVLQKILGEFSGSDLENGVRNMQDEEENHWREENEVREECSDCTGEDGIHWAMRVVYEEEHRRKTQNIKRRWRGRGRTRRGSRRPIRSFITFMPAI